MKKVYLLLALIIGMGFGINAQQNDHMLQTTDKGAKLTTPKSVPVKHNKNFGNHRGDVIQMNIDYDFYEETIVGSQTYGRFAWDYNTNFTNPPDTFTYKYVIVDFDEIIDTDNFIPYDYDDIDSIVIDTIFFAAGHTNVSGMNDTIVLSVIALNQAGYPTTVPILRDTTISNTTMTPGPSWLNFGVFNLPNPGVTIVPPQKFGIRLDYYGPAIDTFGFLAGFTDGGDCQAIPTVDRSAFESLTFPNTYYYYNRFNNQYPRPNGNSIFLNCDGSTDGQGNPTYTPDANEEWYIQNAGIWVTATVYLKDGVGINYQQADYNLTLSPNPANNILNLSIKSENIHDYEVMIANIQGQVVHSGSINEGSNNVYQTIDIGNLANGIYIMKISNGNSYVTERFVVNR